MAKDDNSDCIATIVEIIIVVIILVFGICMNQHEQKKMDRESAKIYELFR